MQVVRAARAIPLLLVAIVLLLGFAACGGDDDDDEGGEATATETQAGDDGEADGAAVFSSAGCGGCHTLAAANSSGQTGPNLDDLMPSQEEVAEQVRNGGGGMPAFGDELSDAEIDAVAQYVADSAGG
jgi:mono/diheme cytochrome c family protein